MGPKTVVRHLQVLLKEADQQIAKIGGPYPTLHSTRTQIEAIREAIRLLSDERYLHTPGWQRMLAEAAEDVRAGRVRTVTVEELMAEVDEEG